MKQKGRDIEKYVDIKWDQKNTKGEKRVRKKICRENWDKDKKCYLKQIERDIEKNVNIQWDKKIQRERKERERKFDERIETKIKNVTWNKKRGI